MFAECLRGKAIRIKEYIDENKTPLKPEQSERLQHMTELMIDQCRIMSKAWRKHDPKIDDQDEDCLDEIDEIVKSMRAEVAETSSKAYAVLKHNEKYSESWSSERTQQHQRR